MHIYNPSHDVRRIACSLFVEEGFQSVSLRRLAAALGMQAGSLYNHMESKQALLFELIEDYECDLLNALRCCVYPNDEPRARVLAFVDTFLGFSRSHPQEMQLARFERRCLSRPQRDAIEALRHAQLGVLSSILQQGIAMRRFAIEEPMASARGVVSLLEGVVDWQLAKPDAHVTEQYQMMVLNLLACRPSMTK